MKSFIRLIMIGITATFALYSCQKGMKPMDQPNTDQRVEMLNAKPSDNIHGTVSVFSTGFNNPRGLKFGPDGNLYVAEAGTGGTTSSATFNCEQVPAPIGPYSGSA